MWLINTTTFALEYFIACPVDNYAILSHTWEDEELDFDLFRNGGGRDKKGFIKIQYCCKQASDDGYKYAWIDTVCIDKRSSTELSEAINSMFAWYAGAGICYAYLQDLLNRADVTNIDRCRWFSRGWTLQELIAPKKFLFFTTTWKVLGTRESLSSRLAYMTGIEEGILKKTTELRDCSIAARMSWAARRKATRIEDIAYCLLGIFDVNMPLLYGEGQKAFRRLQETIVGSFRDESIFAWTGVSGMHGTGLFADSPAKFENAADIISSPNDTSPGQRSSPYSMTNRGLGIERQVLPVRMNTYLSPLACRRRRNDWSSEPLAIYICRTSIDDQYRRVMVDGVDLHVLEDWKAENSARRLLYFNDNISLTLAPHGGMPTIRFEYTKRTSEEMNTSNRRVERLLAIDDFRTGVTCVKNEDREVIEARIGFNVDFEPVCFLHLKQLSFHPILIGYEADLAIYKSYSQTSFLSNLEQNGVDRKGVSYQSDNSGYPAWCFKGNRTSGFDITLVFDQNHPLWAGQSPPDLTIKSSTGANGEENPPLSWNVSMTMRGRTNVSVPRRSEMVFYHAGTRDVTFVLNLGFRVGLGLCAIASWTREATIGDNRYTHLFNSTIICVLCVSFYTHYLGNHVSAAQDAQKTSASHFIADGA